MGMFDALLQGPQGPAMLNPLSDRSPLLSGPQEAMYVGENNAQGLDLDALTRAKAMAGADPETTRQATGWFQAPDGRWRTEIDDSGAKLKGAAAFKKEPFPITDLLDHPQLFKTYPWLSQMQVIPRASGEMEPGVLGALTRNGLEINSPAFIKNPGKGLETLLHEMQHFIQYSQGWATGTDPYQIKADNPGLTTEQAIELYKRHFAEIEARDTEARRPLNPAQRAATPPWSASYANQGYPPNQWIMRGMADPVQGR